MTSSSPAASRQHALPDPWSGPGRSWRQFLRNAWQLARPYFHSEEKGRARAMIAAVVLLNLGSVYMSVLFNEWYGVFYSALQDKDVPVFWVQIKRFSWLAVIAIVIAVYRFYITQLLDLRWRAWMTRHYMDKWLGQQRYYHLELARQSASAAVPDNPDQRIQEDINRFTGSTLGMSMGLLNASTTLIVFVGLLWTLSGSLSFAFWGRAYTLPGYMVWLALAYCAVGSVLAHVIGRKLIRLNFWQEWREADFRYSLVRVREYSEAIALDRGESASRGHLDWRFGTVLSNYMALIKAKKQLIWFTSFFQQAALIFPFLVSVPRYLAGSIKLGDVMQIANAFGKVQDALSWFIDSYGELASWRATTERLSSFDRGVQNGLACGAGGSAQAAPWQHRTQGNALHIHELQCRLPEGSVQVRAADLHMHAGDAVQISGASGSGKSTLLRALAGIWPLASGEVTLPESTMFLPQRPYLPHGSLRAALCYPRASDAHDDQTLRAVLQQVRMPQLLQRLDDEDQWSLKLSGGEQQRIAIARALLHQPRWICADEATSALDADTERVLYEALAEMVQRNGGGLLSVAHRASVAAFHRQRWSLRPATQHAAAFEVVQEALDAEP